MFYLTHGGVFLAGLSDLIEGSTNHQVVPRLDIPALGILY